RILGDAVDGCGSLIFSEGKGTTCSISPLSGLTMTSWLVLPEVASHLPFGLMARAWGRRPGNSTWRPSGLRTWFTGVTTRFFPAYPTRSEERGTTLGSAGGST